MMTGNSARSLAILFFLLFAFVIVPVAGGLIVTEGRKITSRVGETSPVFTITGTDIPAGGTVVIDISYIGICIANRTFTEGNVRISDDAGNASWRGVVSGSSLILRSTGGPTVTGENFTVTFTGRLAGYSAWTPWTQGPVEVRPEVTRTDTGEKTNFTFRLETNPGSGSLTVSPGATITAPTGSTAMEIMISGTPMFRNDTIVVDLSGLDPFVDGGSLTGENLIVTDTARNATWVRTLDSGVLFLVSAAGATFPGERVSVTFTGATGNPWKAGTGGEQTIVLNPVRGDTMSAGVFDFAIDIPPPPGYNITAEFSASPVIDIVPLKVSFADLSSGQPSSWDWDFGDDTPHGTTKNPVHVYRLPGSYQVRLNASNAFSHGIVTKSRFITVLNGGVNRTNTTIPGLDITGCGGYETITVNTSILPANLMPDRFTLEIKPPVDRGLKNITIQARNGVGFFRNGSRITGNPTRVHLESEDISPPGGFSPVTGALASYSYAMDLSSYPCNALLITTIREGILPEQELKLQQVAAGQAPIAVPIGTAYTATLDRKNFPGNVPVKIRGSINTSWNSETLDGGPGSIFFWRISDDGSQGQFLPTSLVANDSVIRIDTYAADSPLGMSTFGLSSLSGNNNPFQLITLTLEAYIQPEGSPVLPEQTDAPAAAIPKATPARLQVQNATGTVTVPVPDAVTCSLYTGTDGLLTQAAQVSSADGYLTVTAYPETAVRDRSGKPLTSITLAPRPSLPALPDGVFSFTGRAYELTPDGATFSPGIQLSFSIPNDAAFGQEFAVMAFDPSTGTWQEIPAYPDAASGRISVLVTHFCCFALFARQQTESIVAATTLPVVPGATPAPPAPSSAIAIAGGLFQWFATLFSENPLAGFSGIIVIAFLLIYEWRQRNFWK